MKIFKPVKNFVDDTKIMFIIFIYFMKTYINTIPEKIKTSF